MRIHRTSIFLSRVAKLNAFVLTLIFNAITSPTYANEPQNSSLAAVPTALAPATTSQLFLAVHPAIGKPNQPRAVFLQFGAPGCSGHEMSFDTSLMESQNLVVIRTRVLSSICPLQPPPRLARFDLEFTPTKAGTLTLRLDQGGPDVTIQSVDSVASKFDVNGMWFDAASNGSGIALHHNRSTTDVAFGTWFLFNSNGESRWYTLQSANWQQNGSVLEGLLIQVASRCPTDGLTACPALGTFAFGPPGTKYGVLPALTRITFQSSTRARAEVLTLSGSAIFISELTKLLF